MLFFISFPKINFAQTETRRVTFDNLDTLYLGTNFTGNIESKWYLDKEEKIQYDNINMHSDGYFNNAFVGIHPQFKQTPPNSAFSITAVFNPN